MIDRLKELAAFTGRLIEFSKQEKEKLSTKQKIGVAAGLGAAALGASFMPAAASMMRIQGREMLRAGSQRASQIKGLQKFVRPPGADANRGGRMVADYIDASQAGLNRGIHGKVIGAVLKRAKENPNGWIAKKLGGDFQTSHYARFRAGPKSALDHWDWEVGEMINSQTKGRINPKTGKMKKALNPEKAKAATDEMARGRSAFESEWKDKMYRGGMSESEAIRDVATNTKNTDIHAYMDRLAATKAKVAGAYAAKGLVAPGLVVAGGGGAYAASRKEKK